MQSNGPAWLHAGEAEIAAHLHGELERLRGCDALAALGLARDANQAEIRAAFLAITKHYHPSRFARHGRDVARLANEVFLCIKGAYQELMTGQGVRRARTLPPPASTARPKLPRARSSEPRPAARGSMDSAEPRAQAAGPPARSIETELGQALVLCRQEQWDEGLRRLQVLALEHPQDTRIRAYLHYIRGHEQETLGNLTYARAEYQRALAIEPSFHTAQHALQALLDAK